MASKLDKLTCCEEGERVARAAGWTDIAEMYKQAAMRLAGKDYRRGNAAQAIADAEWDKIMHGSPYATIGQE